MLRTKHLLSSQDINPTFLSIVYYSYNLTWLNSTARILYLYYYSHLARLKLIMQISLICIYVGIWKTIIYYQNIILT